jgi:predicted double-glycine peptidase
VPAAQVKWRTRTDRTTVPYMRQTTDFTCGPAALSMLLAHYGILERVSRETELELWREATMTVGCDPYGLALAAAGQGATPRITISTGAAMVLVDELLVHGDVCGHWILVHAMDGDVFIAHDPWTETGQGETWVDGYDVPYPAEGFDRIAWTDQPPARAMLTFTR